MEPVMVDGQPLEEKKEKKRRKFRIYHRRRWHESDDELLFKALKLQAIFVDVILVMIAVTSAYTLKAVGELPIPDESKLPYQMTLLVMMALSVALIRRPLIIVEKPEQKEEVNRDETP